MMTAEERAWYLSRYNEEVKKRNEDEKRHSRNARAPSVSRPSVRR